MFKIKEILTERKKFRSCILVNISVMKKLFLVAKYYFE